MVSSSNVTVTNEVDPLTPYTADCICGWDWSSWFDRTLVIFAGFLVPVSSVMPPTPISIWRGGVCFSSFVFCALVSPSVNEEEPSGSVALAKDTVLDPAFTLILV